ncbi:N4-gp56 family major capsid protein [Ruminococcus callidus]|jgi:N4-gp56 family major capsid protein|nr:N4-gp56 family major capsid protein [Ruminococcus callidus]HCD40448.1 N4-gp56 family major capsid protein [Ruminococcus sp.]HCY34099.1 N4-gp56 family major capsid protein [Ruminococcus sp.]
MAETTTIKDLVNPQVMADMISAKITSKIVVTPFAKVDTTLKGVPGDTITVPQYSYIGDAVDVAEGVKADTVKLQTSTTTVKIKKAMKAVELTDESVLSGYGNPVAETNNQIGKSIAAKVDADAMAALQGAQLTYDGSAAAIKYAGIVDAIDVLDEEVNTDKVIFVHPKQVTQLRKDSDFLSADKYKDGVMLTGEIGMVANCRVVPSKKVPLHSEWYYFDESGTAATEVNIAEIRKTLPAAKVGDKVTKSTTACYFCPIVKLNQDSETEDDTAALTIYLKRDTNVEVDRETLARKTDISADRFYAVALSDTSKVVLAKFKK